MNENVTPYAVMLEHIRKVTKSCHTELHLEVTYFWAWRTIRRFFERALAECRGGEAGEIEQLRDRTLEIFHGHYQAKRQELEDLVGTG